MEIRADIDRNRVKRAHGEFEMAESKLDSVMRYTREGEEINHADCFVDAQRSIEKSTKSIFKLMEVNHPTDHSISPGSNAGKNLLNAVADEVTDLDFPQMVRGPFTERDVERIHVRAVARLMFLCEMYGNMYTLAYYGIDDPDFQLPPNQIVDDGEYEAILESAVTALRISDAVIDSISTGELPRANRPTGLEGPMEDRSSIKGDYYGVGKHFTEYDPVSAYRRKL
ncbi:hypothetical protein SAMN04487947_0575 [Halogeometricum rufum]|uniref:HEPN domain-containing protein n=1 Tax=Halogeometricum rufum TaxID=553469 RepID=A0A1I6G590_9EURY|nr:hypothetical protein [Halogeometricum rufum]SFR37207.1 hypothetical protein SAMN04487947_0575 [Halogeometricum rufum]